MKKNNSHSFNRLKAFFLSTKEIGLIIICLVVFFISLMFLVNRVNTNVDVENQVNEYSEQLQLTNDFNQDTTITDSTYVYSNIKIAKGMYFHSVPSFSVWIFIISAFMAISAGLFFPFIHVIVKTIRRSQISRSYLISILLSVLITGFISYLFIHSRVDSLVPNPGFKTAADLLVDFEILLESPMVTINIVVGAMYFVGFLGMAGIIILNKAITKINSKSDNLVNDISRIPETIIRIKSDLRFYLYSLSLLVVGSIITTGLLRESILTILPRNNDFFFPIEFVYLYGLSFSLILVIAYFPVFYNLKAKSKAILSNFDNISSDFESDKIEDLRNKLNIQNTAIDNIKIVISLMAPIVTSFLPNLI